MASRWQKGDGMTTQSTTKEDQIDRLGEAVGRLREEIEQVSAASMSAPLGGWTPRDVVAHLIGWNLGMIEGSRQLLRGELPFYDEDPGEDYSKINERFVRRHASEDRESLLGELVASAERLGSYLTDLEPGEWARDSEVAHGDDRLTVRDAVDELIADYAHHSDQLCAWTAGR